MKHKEVWIVICALCASLCLCSPLYATVFAQRQPPAGLTEATELLQARRFEEAEAATRKVLNTNPRNADARALLALSRNEGVSTVPGQTQFTRMFCFTWSMASARVKPCTAALLAV